MTDDRLAFDFRVIRDMAQHTDIFTYNTYASVNDLRAQRMYNGSAPGAYLIKFNVPTLVGEGTGAGELVSETTMAIDVRTEGYPVTPPNVTVVSRMPYSPHFKENFPVCIGSEAWADRAGHVTLGHLIIHLAKLLNWDEQMRGGGYVGWNAAAIAFHKRIYNGSALNPNLAYPALPAFLSGSSGTGFRPSKARQGFEPRTSAFKPR